MEDTNIKTAENKQWTFMNHLQKVEIWLLAVLKNPEATEKNVPEDALLQERATNILDSLLTNFAKNDLLKKCLELFFPNGATSSAGNAIYKF
ncbi:unnamed protein product [Adineta steineri]|uniref:Uncharacterized protein n=1 Tax=Adineta steineri TaxID=433720 RepID=A0A818PGL6_9BILA|nr:unnamed protein product [Adineta steineri]CAF1259017.1 unnamed protein product [Adineta steineri]CAF3607192.1 unnamed protein product [Adineta steineri]CAF3624193.1 unnamed protein product [Adineta steineri]